MRIKTGSDGTCASRNVSTRRPNIRGTFPYHLSLLRHCGCCRKQRNGTDYKNDLLHRLSSGCYYFRPHNFLTRSPPWSGIFLEVDAKHDCQAIDLRGNNVRYWHLADIGRCWFPWHSSFLGGSLTLSQTTILETEAVTI